jgi:hypothetical protein
MESEYLGKAPVFCNQGVPQCPDHDECDASQACQYRDP